jgi:hypothetical protein
MQTHMIPVSSSKLKAVGYEASPMILRIEFFKDGTFEYYGVPELIYNDLMSADSLGVYFKRYIKDRYRYVKVG